VHAHLPGDVAQDNVSVFQLDAEGRVGQVSMISPCIWISLFRHIRYVVLLLNGSQRVTPFVPNRHRVGGNPLPEAPFLSKLSIGAMM